MTASRRAMLTGVLAAAGAAALPAAARPGGKGRTMAPSGFWWGTATSAHQIEGNNVNSDFWLAEHVKPTAFTEPSGDACDAYHRYAEDIALAQRLGFNAHRFGIEWSRIEPEPGQFSVAELDHYARVLDACAAHGLAPMVTLGHWSVPRWFAARGGFEEADSPELFARFADRVGRHLGGRMAAATTFNEANIARLLKLSGLIRPPVAQLIGAMLAACARASGSARFANVLFADIAKSEAQFVKAHDLAVAALKAGPGRYPVGVTLTMQAVEGVGEGNQAESFKAELYGPWLDVARRADFVGVQTYTRFRVGPDGLLPPPDGAERTAAGYEFYPQALGATIRDAWKLAGRPIYVTENGIATNDDSRRVAYIDAALAAMRAAQADGADVRGYFHWSLLDNFEWTAGYAQHFGLVAVDRASFKRTPKPSAVHLGKIAQGARR